MTALPLDVATGIVAGRLTRAATDATPVPERWRQDVADLLAA